MMHFSERIPFIKEHLTEFIFLVVTLEFGMYIDN